MFEIVEFLTFFTPLCYSLYRWIKVLFYILNGTIVMGQINGGDKTKFRVKGLQREFYYRTTYVYKDDGGVLRKGKMTKLTRLYRLKYGKNIKVIYLNSNKDKSIAITYWEFFRIETLLFLTSLFTGYSSYIY